MDMIVFLVCEFCHHFQQFVGQNHCDHCQKAFTTKALTNLLFSKNEYEEDS